MRAQGALAATLERAQETAPPADPRRAPRPRPGAPAAADARLARRQGETGPTILLIEDDPAVADLLVDLLRSSGHAVWHAPTGAAGEQLFDQAAPDLVILDLMLPDTDGLVLCAKLQERSRVPIIILSGTRRQRDAILALRLGADDFIAKPFDVDELEARVQAVLRRSARGRAAAGGPPAAALLRIGPLVVDDARRRATLGGQLLPLTPTEYRLLLALASRVGETVTRAELGRQISGHDGGDVGRMVDVHVSRLRAKLHAGPVPAPAIVSVRSAGYRMVRPQPSLGAPPS